MQKFGKLQFARREARRHTRDGRQVLLKRGLKEAKMLNSLKRETAKRCAVCHGKFGLIRHYSWRTAALCSRECCDRLTASRERDRTWLGQLLVGGSSVSGTGW